MVDPKNGWLSMGIRSAMATIVVAIVAMGCATSEAPSGDEPATSMVQTIGDVSVVDSIIHSVPAGRGTLDPVS